MSSEAITAAVGLLIGVRMATRVGTPLDKAVAYFAAISFAVPGWWLGILFILLFAFQLNWLPSGGMFSTPPPQGTWPRLLDLGKHALLPIITLVTVSVGPYIYTVRTMTMTVAQEDHVDLPDPLPKKKGSVWVMTSGLVPVSISCRMVPAGFLRVRMKSVEPT
jgi:peptide/nickel transport system permease protein